VTTLATYTFQTGSNLGLGVVRCYATGRYLNNTGAQMSPTLTTTVNGVAQCSLALPFNSSTLALGWRVWAHFYVSQALPQAGGVWSIGSNIEVLFSTAQASATTTGTFAGMQALQVTSNPYNTALLASLQNTLAVTFTPAGADVVELHTAYMEAL
jgi:hypothetical protein